MTAVLVALCVLAWAAACLASTYILADRGARRRSPRYARLATADDARSWRWRYVVLTGGALVGAGALFAAWR